MNITMSRTKSEYLDQVRAHLGDIPTEDLEEVIQDLEAHLAELGDADIETELGAPAEFAHEFRLSAGLGGATRIGRLARMRSAAAGHEQRLKEKARRLGQLVHWESMRPLWVWTRGWVLVSAFSILYYEEGFRHFPIPSLDHSTLAGLLFVVIATAVSIWIDREPAIAARSAGTSVFSIVAGLALVLAMLNPLPDPRAQFEGIYEPQELISPGGKTIQNIYAYDIDGNPLEVLLFDEDGEPLLLVADWFVGEAEMNDGELWHDGGVVRFHRDEFDRVIPNLYPLVRFRPDELGNLQPVPPPSLGFPGAAGSEAAGGGTAPESTFFLVTDQGFLEVEIID